MLTSLPLASVRNTARSTQHALGNVNKDVAERVTAVRDWHPAFAMTHVFSLITEHCGFVPTYQDFRSVARTDEFEWMLWRPAKEAITHAQQQGATYADAQAAMQWRIGNAYYSFLREAFVISALRERGLNVRSHPLADALFRVDCWVDDINVDLYVSNRRYRQGTSGRKSRSAEFLADADPPFKSLTIEMPTAEKFGVVHLPSEDDLSHATTVIRESLGTSTSSD